MFSLFWNVLNTDEAINHVLCIEDQEYLRNNLDNLGLCAFVGNGSILPRASGANDEPMIGGDVVRFISPESLRTTIQLPNKGNLIGMGIKKGVICICGGGYNGNGRYPRGYGNPDYSTYWVIRVSRFSPRAG